VPIDLDRVLGASLPESTASWDAEDVILYHLAVGAGAPPTDASELAYTLEDRLKVLPSYGVLPAMGSLLDMLRMDGMDVKLASLLHGEQDLEIHGPIPTSGLTRTSATVAGVYDKAKAALVVLETSTRSQDDGRMLFTNRFGAFFRGEGGFGGDAGPPTPESDPERPADHVATITTLPQQALLYRLCGDRNPLHADPAYAARAGFDRPILHGLCAYGIVCKALVDSVLDGDVTRASRYRARFSGILFPGETIELSIWQEPGRALASARCVERAAPVLSNVSLELR